ncbi:MAG TPA: hypothetical protein VEF04_13220 [Blastocatellia bacterium]|nr:hypothetical protein [Blastocatellia bacterium]
MPSYYTLLAEIEKLIGEFESCLLPKSEWTHQAHLTVGLWYLSHYSRDEATTIIRSGIQRYNEACGVITTDTSGYHETITLFFIAFIHSYLESLRQTKSSKDSLGLSLVEVTNKFFEQYSDKNLPLQFYSRERLMSRDARYGWIEPDLKSLE